jgi:hypothetical protein
LYGPTFLSGEFVTRWHTRFVPPPGKSVSVAEASISNAMAGVQTTPVPPRTNSTAQRAAVRNILDIRIPPSRVNHPSCISLNCHCQSYLLRFHIFRAGCISTQRRRRELCPHIIGTSKDGEEVVLTWQFGGESFGKVPQWRCRKLANVGDPRARDGRWHEEGSHKSEQSCVANIDLDINIPVRKTRR